jgi:hypothetical protein
MLVALASTLGIECDHQTPTQPANVPANQPASSAATSTQPPAASLGVASKTPEFDPHDFVRVVDNRLFPLRPGTRFIYKGEEDAEPERVVTDVTHDEKTILGVKVVVVLDRVYMSGELKEKTLDWYAQDKRGNIWYFGEDSKEYEDGEVVSTAGSWEAGKDGARAGIIMPAHPHVGQVTQQEFAAGVAEDMARVLHLGLKVSVPYGSFHACVETEEFTPLEPGTKEVKFYCPRIGFVKARDVSGGTAHIALTKIIP